MRNSRKDTLLLAAGVLGAFGAGLAAGRSIARAASPAAAAHATHDEGLPRASLLDTLALGLEVFAPVVAQGVIIRRPVSYTHLTLPTICSV